MSERKVHREVQWTRGKVVFLVLICMILSAIVGFGATVTANRFLPAQEGNAATEKTADDGFTLEEVTGSNMSIQEIASKNSGSIVEIRTESVEQDPWLQEYVTEGAGSGIIIKSDGYIMTNHHVIAGAGTIYVSNRSDKADSDREYKATLVGVNKENDIAVLKIDAEGLAPVTYGNSDKVQPGDLAVIIGNPLGELGDTVSAGVISAKDRTVSIEDRTMSLMQTDASVNPGNSGGGLFNESGQLIGVVVAKSAGSNVEGIGFAIPVNVAAKIADEIITSGGDVSSSPSSQKGVAYSGMRYVDLTDKEKARNYDVATPGIYIEEVVEENPRSADFRSGDMVYSIDGKRIDSLDSLQKAITAHSPGETAKFVIVRDGERISISLELIRR